ncbi:MAG TPA: hypothetical protein VI731_12865, partial [Bacteroidia bacterium]|nr:hypothetical protein [Bacteroidia bacterium]
MRFLNFILISVFFFSCAEEKKPPKKKLTKAEVEYLSKEMNAWDKIKEKDEINQYIKAHGYTMTETASGLRYMTIKKADGPKPQPGKVVKVNYKIYLLDGTVLYTSGKEGAEFVVEKDYV